MHTFFDSTRKSVLVLFFMIMMLAPYVFAQNTAAADIKTITDDEFAAFLSNPSTTCLVVAMASWCGPCKEELPTLVSLYNEYKSKGLCIRGVSLDYQGPQAIAPIADAFHVPFPIDWIGEEAMEKFRFYAIPMTLVVQHGEIIDRLLGVQPENILRTVIKSLIAEE